MESSFKKIWDQVSQYRITKGGFYNGLMQDLPPFLITLEGLFEINGISGKIKQEPGEIKVHLHGSISKAGKEVSGGAINEGTRIFKVVELVIIGIAE